MKWRKRKNEKKVRWIVATLSDKEGVRYTERIVIPEGCRVSHRTYSVDLVLIDKDGNVVREIAFQAGHTVNLEYEYDD